MKKSFVLLTITVFTAMGALGVGFTETQRQALRLVGNDVESDLAKSGVPTTLPLAILPIRGDREDDAMGVLKTAVTDAGLHCVEGKEDEQVQQIYKEVEFDERESDILDTNTISHFGQLHAAKLMLYGVIRDVSGDDQRAFVEIELHIYSIETKRILWSRTFTRRYYAPNPIVGPTEMTHEVRSAIENSFTNLPMSLQADGKLRDVHSVLIVPLAGDSDRFVTALAQDALSVSQCSPKQLDTPTLGDARALLRDDPKAADAILYGAVRDLSMRKMHDYVDHTEYEIDASVQLTIQAAPAGEVLWSKTVETATPYNVNMTGWEATKAYGPVVGVASVGILHLLLHSTIFWIAVGAVGAFVVLVVFLWFTRRAR
jgi:hypothetical protein